MADRYWVGGTASWDATAGSKWATTSGGAGGSAVPTSADDVYIDSGSGAVTVTVAASSVCRDLRFVSGAGSFAGTFAGSSAIAMHGSFVASASMTWTHTGVITASATTAQTITSNGKALTCPITFDGVAGSWALQDALTTDSTLTVTLTNGALNLNGYNLTAGTFSSNNANVRSITSGAGQFYLTRAAASGTVTVFNLLTVTNLTLVDRPVVNVTGNGTSVFRRGVDVGAVGETKAPDVNFTAGSDRAALGLNGTINCRNVNFTGFSGSLTDNARTIYGNLTVSSTMTSEAGTSTTTFAATSGTQTITSNGVTLDFPVTVNAPGATLQLADALTIGSTRTFTHTAGGLDLAGFNLTAGLLNSNNSNVRSITSGAGQFYITGTSGTPWSTSTITNLTMVDRPTVNVTGAPTTGTRTLNLGSLAENRVPTVNISAGTATLGWDGAAYTMDFTGYAGTLSNPGTRTIYGNLTVSATMTPAAGTTATTFAATSGTQTITSNGVTLDFPITSNCPGATVQLADALTLGSTRTFTLTNGSLDLNGFNLTAGAFSSSNTNVRSITSGAGQFYCTAAASSGTSIPFNANVTTNLTFADRPTINLTGNGSGTAIRQIYLVVGQTEALAPDVNVTAGTDTVAAAVTTNMPMRNLNFTGFSGVLSGSVRGLYGNLTLSPTMTAAATVTSTTFAATSGTQVITSNGVTLDFSIVVAAVGGTVQLADALTLGSTRTFTFSNGSLNLNGFNLTTGLFSSSNANVRSITSGGGQFYFTGAAASGTSSIITLNTITNLTLVDRPTFNLSGNGSGTAIRQAGLGAFAEAVAPDINVTAGTDTAQIPSNSGGVARSINFTGFSGTWANATRTIYGSPTLSPTMTATAGTLTTTFAATSGTQVITSNGVTLDFPITANCPGATVQLADALTMAASRALTLTAGTFDANNKNVTTGNFTAGAGATTRVTSMGTGTWTILDAGATAWSTPAAASHTVTPSTSTVLMTAATAKTFAGGGRTFWNLSNGGAGALTITGANTYNDLQNTVTPATFTLPASTTTTVSALSLAGTSGNLVTLDSSTPATRATLSKASGTVDVSYLSIKDSAATGGATWQAKPHNGNLDAGNNTGWTFSYDTVAAASMAMTAYAPTFEEEYLGSLSGAITVRPALSGRVTIN